MATQPDSAYRLTAGGLERGLYLGTGWAVHPAAAPGWVGLDCPAVEVAAWFAEAVRAENVAARSEGATLLVPVAADSTLSV